MIDWISPGKHIGRGENCQKEEQAVQVSPALLPSAERHCFDVTLEAGLSLQVLF